MTSTELKEPLLKKKKSEEPKPVPKPAEKEEDYKQQSIWTVLKFALKLLWERSGLCIKIEIFLVFFFIIASKFVNALGPIYLKYAVDIIESPTT